MEVVVFLNVECPVSNRYVPVLRRLAQEFGPRGVVLRGLFPERELTRARLEHWEKEYEPGFPVERDRYREEVKRARATRTPEAAVYVEGKLVYRGRIDDRYTGWGKYRAEATREELRLVLEAALEGRRVQVEWKEAVGCGIER